MAQHHDAVSGTAKQHVTFDYAKRLARGRTALSEEGESLGRCHDVAVYLVSIFQCRHA